MPLPPLPVFGAITAVAALLTFSALPRPARAVSFDCSKARAPVELMICRDSRLSELDDRLDTAYRAASGPQPSPQLRAEQNAWRAQRDRCGTAACVADFYQRRITELSRIASAPSPAPLNDDQRAGRPPPPLPPPPAAEDLRPLPDRFVWQGQFQCGPSFNISRHTGHLVVFGSLQEQKPAYFILETQSMNGSTAAGMAEYGARYDEILETLRLSNGTPAVQGSGANPPRELNLAFERQQTAVRGRLAPDCEFTLSRKNYPAPLVAALSRLKAGEPLAPSATLSTPRDRDEFCLVLAIWARPVKAGAAGRDLARPVGSDPASRMFLMSAFHESLTRAYLGHELRNIRNNLGIRAYTDLSRSWWTGVQACIIHPLFLEDRGIFRNVFYAVFTNIDNLQTDLTKLPDIQDKAQRIGQAAGRFSDDMTGLVRLREYMTPLETELAGAIPPVRELVLGPLSQRYSEIAGAVLRIEVNRREARSLDQLVGLADTVALIKAQPGPPGGDTERLLARAETIIAGGVRASLAADLRAQQDVPPTLDGLARAAAFRVDLARRYGRFSGAAPYQEAVASLTAREAVLYDAVRQNVAASVEAAPDAQAVRAIRTSINAAASAGGSQTAQLWGGYRSGLIRWLEAETRRSPEEEPDPPPVASPPPVTVTEPSPPPRSQFGAFDRQQDRPVAPPVARPVTPVVQSPMQRACIRAAMPGRSSPSYCGCAGRELDTLDMAQKEFITKNPGRNLPIALDLIPELDTALGRCGR